MSKVKVFDESNINEASPMVGAVQQLLIQKAIFEKLPQDKTNRTTLGGVSFFFDEINDQYILCYDKHPKNWNELLIKNDIDEWEKYMAVQKGVQIHDNY